MREPTELEIALGRLHRMSTASASPTRMSEATIAIVEEWSHEDALPADIRRRFEELRDTLEAGLEAAREQSADVDTSDKSGVDYLQRIVCGLEAAVKVARRAAESAGG